MRDVVVASSGVFPDGTFHAKQIIVAFGDAPTNALTVHGYDPETLSKVTQQVLPMGYARSDARIDGPWVAYRALVGDRASLWHLDDGHLVVQAGPAAGNAPVAVGHGYWAWQGTDLSGYVVYRAPLSTPRAWVAVRAGAPTGLSRILPDGTVRLIDEDRLAMSGGTIPAFAGDLSVCEGPLGGTLCRLASGQECLLWPGQISYTPRCATDGARYAVLTWGDGASRGVRLATVTPLDFASPQPVLDTSGQPFDLMPFFVGGEWPHTARLNDASGVLDCLVNLPDRPHTFTFLKWQNRLCQEVYRYDDEYIYHHEDHTDEQSEGGKNAWHYTDGRWVARLARVGDVIHAVGNRLQRVHQDGSRYYDGPQPYTNTVEAHYLAYPFGGDIGTREAVVLKIDPTESQIDHRGEYEKFYLAKDWGWAIWEAYDYHGDVLRPEKTARLIYRGGARVQPAPLQLPLPLPGAPAAPPLPVPSGVDVLYPRPDGAEVPRLVPTGTHRIMDIHLPPCAIDLRVRVELVDGNLHGQIETMDGRLLGRSGRRRPVLF